MCSNTTRQRKQGKLSLRIISWSKKMNESISMFLEQLACWQPTRVISSSRENLQEATMEGSTWNNETLIRCKNLMMFCSSSQCRAANSSQGAPLRRSLRLSP